MLLVKREARELITRPSSQAELADGNAGSSKEVWISFIKKTSHLCQVKHKSMGTYDLCELQAKTSPEHSDEVDHCYVYSLVLNHL